jgi:hypothetical protein
MNIASNEEQSFDVTGKWLGENKLHVNIRLNEDGSGDTEIDYVMDRYDLAYLIDYLVSFAITEPKTLE